MKKHLFPLVVSVLALASCTSEEIVDVNPTQGNVIGFTNAVNKNSRAVEGDLTLQTFDKFLVYGYYTKAQSITPIQIFNGVEVNLNKDTKQWSYDGVRYWVPNCTYHFYAYSCADIDLKAGMGSPTMTLTNNSNIEGRALAIMSYLCDNSHQHDLIVAENENVNSKDKNNEAVSLNFTHALCKIKAVFTSDFPSGYSIKVSNVKITEFENYADLNVGTGVWSNFRHPDGTTPFVNFTIPEDKNTIYTKDNNSVTTSEVFMIPKQYSDTEWAKIHFTIEIKKDNELVLERNIIGTWSPQWYKASIYQYNINITGSSAGIEPIVFSAVQSMTDNSWGENTEVKMNFGVDAPAGAAE